MTAHSREVSVYLKSLDDLRFWATYLQAPAPTRRRLGDWQDVWESDAIWSGLGGIATPVRLAHVSVGVVGVAS